MSETRMVSRTELVRTQQEAGSMVRRALGAIALVPVVAVGATLVAPLLVENAARVIWAIAGLYVFVASFFGSAFLIGGAVQHWRTTRRLKAFEDILQLPEARVVRD